MNIPETQKEALVYLDGITRTMGDGTFDRFTTTSIAQALSVSRNLVSQYLNDFVRAGLAVKVGSRPVYFFHRRSLERYLQTHLKTTTFSTFDDLLSARKMERARGFERAIGYDLSLRPCVEQLKAAMCYPPSGLPVLLVGQRGVGKAFLVKLMFEWGQAHGLFSSNDMSICIDCAGYADDARGFVRDVLQGEGARAVIPGGLVHFKDVDMLPRAACDALLSHITVQSSSPTPVGREGSVRYALSTTCGVDSTEIGPLARHIPMTIFVPSLSDRTPEEREELALHFLKRESRRMGTDMMVSQGALRRLARAELNENIRELESGITACCAEAYARHAGDQVVIHSYQLPASILGSSLVEAGDEDQLLIDVAQVVAQDDTEIIRILNQLVDQCAQYHEGTNSDKELVSNLVEIVRNFEDYLVFNRGAFSAKASAYEHVITSLLDEVEGQYSIDFSARERLAATREICLQIWPPMSLSRWKSVHCDEIEELLSLLSQKMRFAHSVSDQMVQRLSKTLGVEADAVTRLYLTLLVRGAQGDKGGRHALGVILSHGYSTASSIADAANRFLHQRVFEAIDMPYDQRVADVIKPLQRLLERFSYCDEVAIMVDMGSLQDVYKDLQGISGMTLGVINNASTGLAVEVGAGLIDGRALPDILEGAATSCACAYRVIDRTAYRDAILFCAEGDAGAADKIKDLVVQSFECKPDIAFISSDYDRLLGNGERDVLFSRYAVRTIVGTNDPVCSSVPYIALEDLIAGDGAARLGQILSSYLDEGQIDAFKRNLVKNLTLRNVVESITILNPTKLFAEIERAVARLQLLSGVSVDGRVSVGLYVHLCCLVERLVTRNPIESYLDEQSFTREHADFIDAFRESFSQITSHYRVEVPVTEIAYAYDYINSKHAPRKHASSHNGSEERQDE